MKNNTLNSKKMGEKIEIYGRTRPIGSTFEVDGKRYQVRKSHYGCWYCDGYRNKRVCARAGWCFYIFREDGESIIVKKIKI